jgi:hypothetical protein
VRAAAAGEAFLSANAVWHQAARRAGRHPGSDLTGREIEVLQCLARAAKAGGFEPSVKDSVSVDPSAEQSTIAYRIAQEALANMVRHAGASPVTVVRDDRDAGVAIRVEDDGVGCAPDALQARRTGAGLTAMRERAQLAGGWWRIDSDPSRPGTVVAYELPHSADWQGGPPSAWPPPRPAWAWTRASAELVGSQEHRAGPLA